MGFLFGAVFKKQFDSLIRSKYLYIFSAILYLIFAGFVIVDFVTVDEAENYHRSARILFPPEFSKRLVLYEVISLICVFPFLAFFAFTATTGSAYETWALVGGYRPCKIVTQKLAAVLLITADFLITFTIFAVIALSHFRDSTYETILAAQGVIGLLAVVCVMLTAVVSTLIRRKEMALCIVIGIVILCTANIHLIGSWVGMLDKPRALIDTMLAVNPVTLIAGILNYDIMRSWFFYNTSQAVMFRFSYPDAAPAAMTCTATIAVLYALLCISWKTSTVRPLLKKWLTDLTIPQFPEITSSTDKRGLVTALIAQDEPALNACIVPLCAKLTGHEPDKSLLKKGFSKIGFAVQTCCIPDDRVEGYLSFFANLYHIPWQERRQRIDEILTICNLRDIRHNKISKLSTSQQAMLTVAQSLIHTPPYMIWHMIYTHLNQLDRRHMFAIAQTLAHQGITVIITAPVEGICLEPAVDHIIGFKNGTFAINISRSQLSKTMLDSFWK